MANEIEERVVGRPEFCEHCGRPHGQSCLTANNGRMYTKKLKVTGINPLNGKYEDHFELTWHDIKGKPLYSAGTRMYRDPTQAQIKRGLAEGKELKDIRGNEVKLKVESEFVFLTKVMSRDGKFYRYLCSYCRAEALQKRAAANAKPATENMDPLFDLSDIDAKGKALKEQKKKERREAKMAPEMKNFGDD